jgi:hypothetical protein
MPGLANQHNGLANKKLFTHSTGKGHRGERAIIDKNLLFFIPQRFLKYNDFTICDFPVGVVNIQNYFHLTNWLVFTQFQDKLF